MIYKGNDNYYLEATSTNASKPDAGLIAGGTYADAYGTAALPANTWSYLAETYDGTTLRLYVNGTQVASTAHTGSITTSTNQLQIGGDSIYGQYFAGMIDEVRIYNTALTAAQIQTDQTTPVGSNPLSAPGTLSANAVSPTEIDLSWGAATGGATGYLVERCTGANCSNFTQIGTSSTTTYKDTDRHGEQHVQLPRPCHRRGSGDLGPYSNTATATTAFTVSPNNAVLTFTRTQQYTAQGPGSGSVTWLVDGVAGGNSSSRARSPPVASTHRRARRHAHHLRDDRDHDGERHRLRLELRRHVHLPQRQRARRREPERDRAHADERQLDDVREALQLPARRASRSPHRSTCRT